MAFTTREARDRIIGDLEAAEEELAVALAALGEAFEMMASGSAERLEDQLFRPLQRSFVRNKRTRVSFAKRVDQETDEPAERPLGPPSQGVKGFVEQAATAAANADLVLSDLQDSMMPIEGGDAELRAGIAAVRELLAPVQLAARGLLRGLGR